MIPLKVDPKLFHHYLIGVGMHSLKSGKHAGKLFLKYGPVHFTNDDVNSVLTAVMLSNDKLFETTEKQALKIHGCTDIVATIGAMKFSISVNDSTMHHFSSEFEIDEDWFITLVNVANSSKANRELLEKSRVHC